MTLTDGIILGIVGILLAIIIYKMFIRRKSPCESCAYLKHCESGCSIEKKAE